MNNDNAPAPEGLPPELSCWFDFASNYSYLSIMRIEALCKQAAVTLRWRPFLLGPIFRSFGWNNSPFVLQQEKGRYVWTDMARQCEKHRLPWTRPSVFPRSTLLPSRIAVLHQEEPWMAAFCRAVMLENFAKDQDVDNVETMQRLLRELGQDADAIIAAARSDTGKPALRKQTEDAAVRGIFGAPTFFVGNDIFWGNDRLNDAIAHALRSR